MARIFSGQMATYLVLGLFVVLAVGGSIHSVGLRLTSLDLIQIRETDSRAGWGTHWQMHFLSTAVLLLLLMFPGTLFDQNRILNIQALELAGVFVGLSAICKCRLLVVTHSRWVLHGAREVFTYFLIVALPAFSPLLLPRVLERMHPSLGSAAVVVLLLGAAYYFLHVFRRSDLNAEASSQRGLLYLLSSHFFEHVLDTVYIALLILAAGSL